MQGFTQAGQSGWWKLLGRRGTPTKVFGRSAPDRPASCVRAERKFRPADHRFAITVHNPIGECPSQKQDDLRPRLARDISSPFY
jgi:hypothetical protein